MTNYVFGSIHPVKVIDENVADIGPLAFQGKIEDKLLMPKKAQIPFITNQSTCTFPDDSNGMTLFLYNISDDKWYNSTDPSDYV